ncbi:hypothetical protein J4729_21785 [Leisingera sp. HS039]|nr:hypothetical protein [Leisingera sp. HS039]
MLHHEPYALECLAKWGHLTDIQIEEMPSWTGRICGDARILFSGEIYVSRSLRNPVVRGCPKCLREDLKTLDPPLAETMVKPSVVPCGSTFASQGLKDQAPRISRLEVKIAVASQPTFDFLRMLWVQPVLANGPPRKNGIV